MKNFTEFRKEKEIKNISEKYKISETMSKSLLEKIEDDKLLSSSIRLMNLRDEPKKEIVDVHENNKKFLIDFFKNEKQKSEKINEKFNSIFARIK